jgi:hypothetical protein
MMAVSLKGLGNKEIGELGNSDNELIRMKVDDEFSEQGNHTASPSLGGEGEPLLETRELSPLDSSTI